MSPNEDKLRKMYEIRYGSYPTKEQMAHLRVYDGGWYDEYVRDMRAECMSIWDTWQNKWPGLDWFEHHQKRSAELLQ